MEGKERHTRLAACNSLLGVIDGRCIEEGIKRGGKSPLDHRLLQQVQQTRVRATKVVRVSDPKAAVMLNEIAVL
jgi:hypothetical protein